MEQHRRSIRLKYYDYSQAGAYFCTIVTQDRACLFGDVANGEMRLNPTGEIVSARWNALPKRFPNIELGEFVVMPNHVHGVVVIIDAANDIGANVVGAIHELPLRGRRLIPEEWASNVAKCCCQKLLVISR